MPENPAKSRVAVRDAMRATGTSQKVFAINARQAESVVSDALNARGRHLDAEWIVDQGVPFVTAFITSLSAQMGITVETRKQVRAERAAELFRLLFEDIA